MAAYAALVSLKHIIDNLENHPRPPIFINKNQVYRLTRKITFLQEFLESYNSNLDYTAEADPLETRIADAAYAAEDVIETHIVDHITNDEENISSNDAAEDVTESHMRVSKSWWLMHLLFLICISLITLFISSLIDNPNLDYTAEADPLETRIADAAYAAEDVIKNDEEKMSSDEVFYEAVEKVIEEMELIEKDAMQIKLQTVGLQHTKSTPSDSSGSAPSIVQQSRMVGADKLLLQMKDELKSDRLNLQIIPITGMGGSGKTTLARNIYQDRLILEHFHIRAWVTISQEYSIPEILQQLLKQLDLHSSEGELGDKLHKHLFGRRYLIVLDDMWSIRAWEGVKMFLPNNINGSKIVVTTRLSNLFSKLPNSSSLRMNLLDEDDSWHLLSKTVFGEKDCPLEFEEIGKEIGKSCKGLPLSIVVVGGLLAKSEHTIEFWKHIEENLNSIVNLEDDERYLKILYMSYKQLPVHLKPCFLYMGIFPEDEEIRISKLVRLWVAEGFLKPVSKKGMEEIAKEYLEDLIGRNLILIHRLGEIGEIKECKIHDLLRDLCLREAEKERFYTIVAGQTTPQGIVNAAQRRIVVSNTASEDEAINALSSVPLARSLIWNLDNDKLPPLNLMRLLRILESSDSYYDTAETCIESIHQLVNSRYINNMDLTCRQSIGRFWNLQTLYFRSLQLRRANFILDMTQIRHFQCEADINTDQLEGDNVLGNLQSLGTVYNFKGSKEIVKRIPNIKKLDIRYKSAIDDDTYCLNNIVCLNKLEALTSRFYQSGSLYLERLINFPNSLIKLRLLCHDFQCWGDILDKVAALPLLQKLILYSGRFTEGQWETTEGGFRSLKSLTLTGCENLQVWTTESSHFPCLDHLSLYGLEELEEITLDFAEISTLRVIDVTCCSDSIVVSAKRIVEEQEELYGEEAALQVQVTLSERNNEELESLASPNFHVKY